ncbi:MAG: ABC transporter ATP-binding protein [Clostridia bacterium]|nr:ABC transporter ATP-binding protein [Clostridia bacterium]
MIYAEHLQKNYGDLPILTDVELHVPAGEFLSIMGESGSGKSTLLNILAGNLPPDGGRVSIGGEDIHALSDRELSRWRRTRLGFVYQSLNLIPTLTLRENILLPLYLSRTADAAACDKMAALSERFGITARLSAYPDECSGGQRQRAAIARAMLHDPDVLFLDEPTGSLDAESAAGVMELLSSINREGGLTVVQVTHSRLAAGYGTRTVLLRSGRLEEQ